MNSLGPPQRYIFKFRLFVSSVQILSCLSGNIGLVWKTPNAVFLFQQLPLVCNNSLIEVNSEIEIEQTLYRQGQEEEFMSLETELLVLDISSEPKIPLASLKIDLAALANAEILNCVKRFSMSSYLGDEAWISFAVSGVDSMRVSESQAVQMEYLEAVEGFRVQGHIRQVISHMNTQMGEDVYSDNPRRKKKQPSHQRLDKRIMVLLDGKNRLIDQLEEKINFLIEALRTSKSNQARQSVSQRKSIFDSLGKHTGRGWSSNSHTINSTRDQTARCELEQHPALVKENCALKSELQRQKVRQLQLKTTIHQLQSYLQSNERQEVRRMQLEEQIKEYRQELYAQKKKNILVREQNERLSGKMSLMQQENNPLAEDRTIRSQHRYTEMMEDRKLQLDRELQIKSQELQFEVAQLRQQVTSLRKRLNESQTSYDQLIEKSSVGLEDKIKNKIQDYKTRLSQNDQKHEQEIRKLHTEFENMQQTIGTLERKKSIMEKHNEKLSVVHQKAEQRRATTESIIFRNDKFQRRCHQLENINKQLQSKITKQEEEIEKKKASILELTQQLNQRQSELHRLRRLEGQYQKQVQKLKSLSEVKTNNKKLSSELFNVQLKKTNLQHKITQITQDLRCLQIKLDQYIQADNNDSIQKIEKQISVHEQILKERTNELDVVESELLKRKHQIISSENTHQMGLMNTRLQQITQQNHELKNILKELIKKASIGVSDIDLKDNLLDVQIREKQMALKHQQFGCVVEEIVAQYSLLDEVTVQATSEVIQSLRGAYGQRIAELKQEFSKLNAREIDLCLREKKLRNIQIKADTLQVIKKLLILLDGPGSLKKGRSHEDAPKEQPLQYVRKQKEWELKMLQQQEKIRKEKNRSAELTKVFQDKIRVERRNQANEAREALEKQRAHLQGIHQKKVAEKQKQIQSLRHNFTKQKSALDQQVKNVLSGNIRLQSDIETETANVKEHSMTIKQLAKTNKFYDARIKHLQLQIQNLNIKLDTGVLEYSQLQSGYQQLKVAANRSVFELKDQYNTLVAKTEVEMQILSGQIQRLRFLIEEAVIRQLQMEDQNQKLSQTIQANAGQINNLHSQLSGKDRTLGHLREEINHEVERQRVCDEEYSHLLGQFQNQGRRLVQLKAEFAQLQILQTKAEQFISQLEADISSQKGYYEGVLYQRNRRIQQLVEEINRTMRENVEVELNYRRSVNEFELHIHKMEVDRENMQQKIQRMQAEMSCNAQQASNRVRELTELSQRLTQELKFLKDRERRQEAKSKLKKFGNTDNWRNPVNVAPSANKSRISQMPSQLNKSQIHSSSTPRNESSRRDSMKLPGFQLKQVSQAPVSEDIFGDYRISVVDPKGNFGQVLESPTKLRKIQFPVSAQQPPQHKEEEQQNDQSINDPDSNYELYQQQIQKQKARNDELASEVDDLVERNTDLETANKILEKDSQDIRKSLQMALKRCPQNLQMEQSQHFESYFDFQERDQIGPIPIDQFRRVQLLGRQLSFLEKQFTSQVERLREYASSIEDMNGEIQVLTSENAGLRGQVQRNERASELEKILGELRVQKYKADTLIVGYESALEINIEERDHSTKVLLHLQQQNDRISKNVVHLQETIKSSFQQLNLNQESLAHSAAQNQALQAQLLQLETSMKEFESQIGFQVASLKSQLLDREHQLSKTLGQLQQRGQVIQQLHRQQLFLEQEVAQLGTNLAELDHKFTDRNAKLEDLLAHIVVLNNSNAVLELQIKQMIQEGSFKERSHTQVKVELQAAINKLRAQLGSLRLQNGSLGLLVVSLKQQLENKRQDVEDLKSQVGIFNAQAIKSKKEFQQRVMLLEETESKLIAALTIAESQIGQLQMKASTLERQLYTHQQLSAEHEQEVSQLHWMDKVRQGALTELQSTHTRAIKQHQAEIARIKNQSDRQIVSQRDLVMNESNLTLQKTLSELHKVKQDFEGYRREVEIQRLEMFTKEREFEDTKADYQEQKEEYIFKIEKYEKGVSQIAGKLKDYEHSRPLVELYEQIVFQNEIFKNRIAQLEGNMVFNNNFEVEEEIQIERAKRQQQRKQFGQELEHYSETVAELEEKNYLLESELERATQGIDFARMESDNARLQKEIARLQHSEEGLKLEVSLLRKKREQEYRRLSAQIRSLKQSQ